MKCCLLESWKLEKWLVVLYSPIDIDIGHDGAWLHRTPRRPSVVVVTHGCEEKETWMSHVPPMVPPASWSPPL